MAGANQALVNPTAIAIPLSTSAGIDTEVAVTSVPPFPLNIPAGTFGGETKSNAKSAS